MRLQFGVLVIAVVGVLASVAVVPNLSSGNGLESHEREHMLQHRYGEPHDSHHHEVQTGSQWHAAPFAGLPEAVPLAANTIGQASAAQHKLSGLSVSPLLVPPRDPDQLT